MKYLSDKKYSYQKTIFEVILEKETRLSLTNKYPYIHKWMSNAGH